MKLNIIVSIGLIFGTALSFAIQREPIKGALAGESYKLNYYMCDANGKSTGYHLLSNKDNSSVTVMIGSTVMDTLGCQPLPKNNFDNIEIACGAPSSDEAYNVSFSYTGFAHVLKPTLFKGLEKISTCDKAD